MPKIKLTDADVRGLRYARNVEGASLAFLANAYGVSKAQVSRVTRGLQHRILAENEKPTTADFKDARETLEKLGLPKLEDFCAARRLLEAKDVPIHPDANYAVAAPEVSSHEETPEVGKLSDDEKAHRDWASRYKMIWDDTWYDL